MVDPTSTAEKLASANPAARAEGQRELSQQTSSQQTTTVSRAKEITRSGATGTTTTTKVIQETSPITSQAQTYEVTYKGKTYPTTDPRFEPAGYKADVEAQRIRTAQRGEELITPAPIDLEEERQQAAIRKEKAKKFGLFGDRKIELFKDVGEKFKGPDGVPLVDVPGKFPKISKFTGAVVFGAATLAVTKRLPPSVTAAVDKTLVALYTGGKVKQYPTVPKKKFWTETVLEIAGAGVGAKISAGRVTAAEKPEPVLKTWQYFTEKGRQKLFRKPSPELTEGEKRLIQLRRKKPDVIFEEVKPRTEPLEVEIKLEKGQLVYAGAEPAKAYPFRPRMGKKGAADPFGALYRKSLAKQDPLSKSRFSVLGEQYAQTAVKGGRFAELAEAYKPREYVLIEEQMVTGVTPKTARLQLVSPIKEIKLTPVQLQLQIQRQIQSQSKLQKQIQQQVQQQVQIKVVKQVPILRQRQFQQQVQIQQQLQQQVQQQKQIQQQVQQQVQIQRQEQRQIQEQLLTPPTPLKLLTEGARVRRPTIPQFLKPPRPQRRGYTPTLWGYAALPKIPATKELAERIFSGIAPRPGVIFPTRKTTKRRRKKK